MTAPVETLREAARLMRERAEAVDEIGVETWDGYRHLGPDNAEEHEHIASWPPAVALTVADLLDEAARDGEAVERVNARTSERAQRTGGDGHTWVMHHALFGPALAVARVYLGEAS